MNIQKLQIRCRVDENDCWVWQGSTSGIHVKRPDITVRGKRWYVSRYVWTLLGKTLTPGLCICHTCNNELCINPTHLYEATQQKNMQQASEQGRWKGKVAITPAIIEAVLVARAQGQTYESIAALHGVGRTTVWRICTGVFAERAVL